MKRRRPARRCRCAHARLVRRWPLLTRSRRSQDAAAEAFKVELHKSAEVTDFEKILQTYVAEMPSGFGAFYTTSSPEKKLMMYVEQQLKKSKKNNELLGVIRQHSAAAEACAQRVLSPMSDTKR